MTLGGASRRYAWVAYCAAHFGKSLLWAASDLLTLYVLVTLYRIDPVVAGTLFLFALGANAVADLGVGVWLDRHPRHGAMLATAALAVSAASFPATMLLAPHGGFAVLAAMLVFRIAYAGYDVPHNALMARLAPEPRQATWLSRGRTIGTGLAGAVVAYCAHEIATARTIGPVLWTLSATAFMIGMLLVPLLARLPLIPPPPAQSGDGRLALPWPFLIASVTGIVALGALAKAVLHVPVFAGTAPIDAATMLLMLTAGRTLSALVPLRIADARMGLRLLGIAYLVAALVAIAVALSIAAPALLTLGLAMGVTNLIGWALLPALARGAKGYGIYTMASKLALGGAGLALATGLGRAPSFAPGLFAWFAILVALACLAAALMLWPRLTSVS